MSKNKIFIFFTISFLFWIFISNILFSFHLIILFLSIFMMFLILVLLLIKKHHFFVLFIWLWIFLGSIYSWINNINIENNLFMTQKIIEKDVFIKAEVEKIYKKSTNNNSYILKIISINDNKNYDFKFLAYLPKNIVLEKWQIIYTKSKIDKIDNFSNNFDYIKYMQLQNVFFITYIKNIEIIDKNELSLLTNFSIQFRQKFIEIINEIYPKNEASFLSWILIWAKEGMDENLKISFNNSGLTHLVAVSWFNITIIIIFLWFLFSFIPIILRSILISLFIIFFVFVVWDNVPVLRAGIMWLVGYFILVSWRKSDWLSLLLFTALLLILYNPLYINYDTSFHLSFLAVLGLLYFREFWNKIFKFLPSFFAIKESFVLTMSALTTTLPIMIFNFGQLSLIAPVSNMLVWWFIPFAMLFWFLSIIGQIIWDKFWFILWFINYFILKYIILVAEYFWNLSFSVLKIDFWIYSSYLEILYFMFLVFWVIYFNKKESPKL